MRVKNSRELFVTMLSQVRHDTERTAAVYKELGELSQNSEIQEVLEARALVSQQTLVKLDEAFKIIREKRVHVTGRLQDVFVEDFRRELSEIQSQEARQLFVLAKANHLSHMRSGEYVTFSRGRRCFRPPWRRRAARELPRRSFGLRRTHEAFDPSHFTLEGFRVVRTHLVTSSAMRSKPIPCEEIET